MHTNLAGRVRAPKGLKPRVGRYRALRLALFCQDSSLARAFRRLAASGVDVTAFPLGRVPREELSRSERRKPYDVVVVERPEAALSHRAWLRRLRQSLPETPFIAFGAVDGARPSAGFTVRLTGVPSPDELRALVLAANRERSTAKRAFATSKRLRETSRRLDILTHIVSTANSILEPKRVIAVIMSQIQMLIPSEAWSILLVDEEKQELFFEMALGEKGEDFTDTRLKVGEGIAGWVAESGKPLIVNDVSRDPRFQSRFDVQTRFRTKSILCAPLISRGHTIGVVEIMNRVSGRRFSKRDLDLLLTLVEPAAIALENAILFEKTQRLTITDDLTKLYNSRYLNIYLDREIRRSRRQESSLALIFLDLDGFKRINDQHGHLCGSRALFEVGAILRRSVRETDIVGRYGGDEFVVILPDTTAELATAIAERIRKALNAHPFLGEFGLTAFLSASFGISAFPTHAETPHDLIQKADQAMYSVKEGGKDGVGVAR